MALTDEDVIKFANSTSYRYAYNVEKLHIIPFFKKIDDNNYLLTESQINLIIDKIVKGKSMSSIGSKNGITALTYLTRKHMISQKNIKKVFDCMLYCNKLNGGYINGLDFTWICNLILKGYKLSETDLINLTTLGYKDVANLTIGNENVSKTALIALLSSKNINLKEATNVLTKCKSENIELDFPFYEKIMTNLHITTSRMEYVELLIANGLKIDKKVIDITNDFSIIKLLVSNGAKLYNLKLTDLISSYRWKIEICEIINYFYENGICPKLEHLHKISHQVSNVGYDPDGNTIYKDDHSFHLKYNDYSKLIDDFINIYKIVPSIETMHIACLNRDDMLFGKMYENGVKFDSTCMKYACSVNNLYVIEFLMSNKMMPLKEHLEYMPYGAHSTIKLMIKYLMPINHDILDLLILKGVYVGEELLEKYGIAIDDKLYAICHKYHQLAIATEYYNFFEKSQNVHDKEKYVFRKMWSSHKLEQILDHMKLHKLNIDNYCYNNAWLNLDKTVLEYAEKNMEYMPDIITLTRINEAERRYLCLSRMQQQ
jgi:hypothetical protein